MLENWCFTVVQYHLFSPVSLSTYISFLFSLSILPRSMLYYPDNFIISSLIRPKVVLCIVQHHMSFILTVIILCYVMGIIIY